MNIKDYFQNLEQEVKKSYDAAREARKKGFDPVSDVEIPVATSLAERVVGLVSVLYPQVMDPRLVARILELEKEYGNLDPAVSLKIAEEVAKETFCKFKDHLEAVEAGIRIAIGYLTLGYVSSPIEGFIQLKIKKTADGGDYLAPYYSGPIRSAGGTEAAFSLVIVDYLREMFGYAKYDPTEDEIKRGIHECYEYHERITNLQYLPSEQELDYLLRNLPIQLTGDPSEEREVYNYKDLPRIETNFIRSGFCLVIGEGLAQKAPKILKRIVKLKERGFKLSGWDWLAGFTQLQKKLKEGKKSGDSARGGATYMQDLVAGRPVFSHPSESGGFRLRYGRSRTTGYSTLALHPATMAITDNFIAVGTQLKIEKPTKGCTIASCDSIDGPIVRLKDGSVQSIKTIQEAKQLYPQVDQIIYLGDILVPYGDFCNRNHPLEPAGYVEQYWLEHLKKAGGTSELVPSFETALELSKQYSIPLHPRYSYYWREISADLFLSLIDWIAHGELKEGILILPYTRSDRERFAQGKRALELIGCEHKVSIEHVVFSAAQSQSLLFNLGISQDNFEHSIEECIGKIKGRSENGLVIINLLSSIPIKDKSGTFIGGRMGRPEKAKLRKLIGSPHCLFPVGEEGGRLRSVQAAVDVGSVKADFPLYSCESCGESIYPRCEKCGKTCTRLVYCTECMQSYVGSCPHHPLVHEYNERRIDIKHYFDAARKLIQPDGNGIPIIKGVRGTSSKDHSCEHLAKGFLRAQHSLHVNKDGTIRYDMTEMPLTQFKPREVGTPPQKLVQLGYTHDIHGVPLTHDDQVLELFPHDIVLPSCPTTPDERADDVFLNVARFVDAELEKLYGCPSFYHATSHQDLVGHLFGCMSPHTSATVVGRLIGFSHVQALLASPYIHAAMRRDCDGDEAAVMLLMDLLLNFSRKFLPSHRGGTQDAPLVLNMRIRASEVDDMIFDVDVSSSIPLALYEAAEHHKPATDVRMEQVKERLHTEKEFTNLSFSYDTSDLNNAPLCSSYKTLPTMQEKVQQMMNLSVKLRPVNVRDVARLIIERHFIRDTRGNLRKFSMQVFRCVGCNDKYRRPPLTGKCTHCGGKLIFTISEGSILKYMQPALDIAKKYEVSDYLLESLELTQMYIESIFGREKEKQEDLKKWF
ncbi:DNA polymerase II large subunit [Candidatus Pacearchaeota archaeon]|nr:DNA polymerase II large subunit [Candidatus Pacearchaeota archaeon]